MALNPPNGGEAGAGLAIIVNSNAKRGGRRVAAQIARALPGARVRLTKTIEELSAWLQALDGQGASAHSATWFAPGAPTCILAAGGDGTAIALVNALNRVTPAGVPFRPIGVIPLGTGNAWAHASGAKKLSAAMRLLVDPPSPLPVRSYGLVDCEGTLTHFAGSGWDAQILDDYKTQLAQSKGPAYRVNKTAYGYV